MSLLSLPMRRLNLFCVFTPTGEYLYGVAINYYHNSNDSHCAPVVQLVTPTSQLTEVRWFKPGKIPTGGYVLYVFSSVAESVITRVRKFR